MAIGEAIKNLRLEAILDKSEFARKIEVSPASLTHYENGVRMPRFHVLRKIKKFADDNHIAFNVKEYIS